ncbi:hypothetical protein N7462_004382 [Penicillium macrosclerotiorum]|uniref:uncharacterized protein n=1 Tax=Penicillium macrosclerotiorum TaxID=303699 RepID=UPI002546D33A|nr:uncharacterized protein N7462_004382 [Penicillium macrosclerotiorum]KAJ5689990.1 hypothetical protein N7462_004382 [Penicillium macrosclerotiorum]
MDAAVVRDLTESVYQCLAVDDLLTSPSLSTLQAFLLLLGCPSFTQRPIMIASVIRMASILGMNRPQPKRPIIYWTCVTWARWEAVKSKYKDSAVNHALHLPPPPCEPTNDSFFGRIYHLIAKSQDRDSSEDTHQKLYMQRVPEISLGPDGPEEDDTSAAAGPEKMIVDHLEQVLEVYLFGDSRKWTDAQGEITRYLQSPWYRFHPFCEISKQFGFAAK